MQFFARVQAVRSWDRLTRFLVWFDPTKFNAWPDTNQNSLHIVGDYGNILHQISPCGVDLVEFRISYFEAGTDTPYAVYRHSVGKLPFWLPCIPGDTVPVMISLPIDFLGQTMRAQRRWFPYVPEKFIGDQGVINSEGRLAYNIFAQYLRERAVNVNLSLYEAEAVRDVRWHKEVVAHEHRERESPRSSF